MVSAAALTLRGYAEAVSTWFGKKAALRFLPWDEWRNTVSKEEAAATWDHIAHFPNCGIARKRNDSWIISRGTAHWKLSYELIVLADRAVRSLKL